MPSSAPFHTLMDITARPDLVMARGEGAWLWDSAGRRYLDFTQGWAVNCLGHAHPAVVAALTAQATALINPSPAFYNAPALRLAQRLAALSGLERVFFANSGAEANEGAIKLARKWGQLHRHGAHEIITFLDGFHGRTLATMSASGKPGWDTLFAPQVAGFPKARLNDLASVVALIGPQTVGIMLEPIQGEAGVIPAELDFLVALRDLCDARGLLLIIDEVQTGMGRTGTLFAHQAAGIRPDIMTLGKGLGGGVPLSALLAREAVSCFAHGDQGGTFNGNPLCTAAGNAVLDCVTADGFLEQVCARGAHLAEGLRRLSAHHGLGACRGRGLLLALDLGPRNDAAAIVQAARAHGLLINAARPNCLRLTPALTISDTEIATMLECLDAALNAI